VSARAAPFFVALSLLAPSARADAPTVFGHGARSAALARADTAAPDAASAARQNPAAAAAPGARLRLGYAYGSLALHIDGRDAGASAVSGIDLAAQIGGARGPVSYGAAMALHLPDTQLAAIRFRPLTEPQFFLYEAPLQRIGVDFVAAARYKAFALGAGLTLGLDTGGQGARFEIAQDAGGTRGGARLDVALAYRASPLIGLTADLGRAAVGILFRGPMALGLGLDTEARIALKDAPLNGITTVKVSGVSGYDPAILDFGARLSLFGGLTLLPAIEYAAYGAAPAPVTRVSIDANLGETRITRESLVPEPGLRDTLSPRLGVELRLPAADEWRFAARAGYALVPSPVPPQTGYTSYADGTRHQMALGAGYHLIHLRGVDLSLDLCAQVHVFAPREVDKPSAALPHAHFESGGSIVYAAASIEARLP